VTFGYSAVKSLTRIESTRDGPRTLPPSLMHGQRPHPLASGIDLGSGSRTSTRQEQMFDVHSASNRDACPSEMNRGMISSTQNT
jgi:hypothetical protein